MRITYWGMKVHKTCDRELKKIQRRSDSLVRYEESTRRIMIVSGIILRITINPKGIKYHYILFWFLLAIGMTEAFLYRQPASGA